MATLNTVVNEILDAQISISYERSALIAISGIDADGKGYFTERLVGALQAKEVRAVSVNVDDWLSLPDKRFGTSGPPENYYKTAIRFEEMFNQTVFPLRDHRSLRVEITYVNETAVETRRRTLQFDDVEVFLLEGIYRLKRCFQPYYDRAIWVECGFETALERAISRG